MMPSAVTPSALWIARTVPAPRTGAVVDGSVAPAVVCCAGEDWPSAARVSGPTRPVTGRP